MEFFEVDDTQGEPRAKRTSLLTADRALVQLSQDEKGQMIVASDKQMEFWGVKFATATDAPVRDAEITLERAFAENAVDELRLWTPTDDVAVSIVARGPDAFTVHGLGIRAYIPAQRGPKGKVSVQKQGVFRFTIASQPVLVRGGTTLMSRGPLEYREDLALGVANVSMRDEVVLRAVSTRGLSPIDARPIETPGTDAPGENVPSRVELVGRGRRLDAVLARADRSGGVGDSMVWNRIILRGSPVRLAGKDMRLKCDRVEVLPDLAGDPYWITASGIQPTMYQDRHQARVTATRHIHFIRTVRHHTALLSGYGMSAATMPKDLGQLIIFEGPATVTAEQDGITATAAEGLVAVRGDRGVGEKTPITIFGSGKARVESPEWIVDGNDGFRLREVPRPMSAAEKLAEEPAVNRFLRLGPKQAGPAHAYRIERLPTASKAQPFVTTGTGACDLVLRADRSGTLRLHSAREDIHVDLSGNRGELNRVANLHVRFQEKLGLLGLDASGPDCHFRYQAEKEGWVLGNANEVYIPAPGVLRLVGKPRARVRQKEPMRMVEGREILIQHLGEKAALLHATGDARLRLRQPRTAKADPDTKANPGADKRFAQHGDQDVELLADDIRLLPYLATPTGWQVHARGLPAFAQSLQAYGHRSPFLFADGNVRLVQRDTEEQVIGRGFGEHLVLRFSVAARAVDGRLSGKGAKLVHTNRNGRDHVAKARLIRFANDPRGEHLVLVPMQDFHPRLTLPSPSGTDKEPRSDEGGTTTVVCKGPILATPGKVRFLGPLDVESLDRNGKVDARGLRMTAAGMVMDRDRATGDVTYIQASRDIRFHFQDMDGEADEMSVDLRRSLIVARGTSKPAVLRKANGRTIKAAQVNYNYLTKQIESWNGRFQVATS
ncbi:MAG: hypothetical protein ACYS5W_23845, partial [Planctomycetota bacterium]